MVSIDDKHQIKVGEPGYPVAAAEQGRRVLAPPLRWVTMILPNAVLFHLLY